MFDSSSGYQEPEHFGSESKSLTKTDICKALFDYLQQHDLIGYGKRVHVDVIRKYVDLPEPNVNGLSYQQIKNAVNKDNLYLLSLRDTIFEKYLMHRGMALKQDGDYWVIPDKNAMPGIWQSYANRANNALKRARFLIKNAPTPSGEDAAFAQAQAARVARNVAQLTEQAAKCAN